MDTFSVLNPLSWHPDYIRQHPLYTIGHSYGWLARENTKASADHLLSGRLYVSKSGWLLLSVPNALVRGVFDALVAPGAELPRTDVLNVPNAQDNTLNAHIAVMTADEVQKIGADTITERGHTFHYALGALKEVAVGNIDGVSRLWALQIASPALAALRKSYGLTPLLHNRPFYIAVAVRRKHVLQSNGVRKTANDAKTTYDCGCSGPCMCPETCVCKQSGYCCSAKRAAAVKDILPGGEADHAPDAKFDPAELATGIKHEHEHTDNDQIAKEIAKDHLSEDSAYYAEHKEAQPIKPNPSVLAELLAAKQHSDAGRYKHKHEIIRRLMTAAPDEWHVDDATKKYYGVTHRPTKFKLHVDPTVIPPAVVQKAASVYLNQFWRNFDLRNPITYDHSKPVFANIQNQLAQIKRRGDFMIEARRNNQLYRAALDPRYRHQLAMQAFRGELPQESWADQFIYQHGNSLLGQLQGLNHGQR